MRARNRTRGIRRGVWTLQVAIATAIFLMPAQYSAGAEAPHLHPFYQVWIDAGTLSFSHHAPGHADSPTDAPVVAHDHAAHASGAAGVEISFTPANPPPATPSRGRHHSPHQHGVGRIPDTPPSVDELLRRAPQAGATTTPEVRQLVSVSQARSEMLISSTGIHPPPGSAPPLVGTVRLLEPPPPR